MTFDINVTIRDTRCAAALASRIPITTGCRGEFRAVLHPDESWAGMDKTVVFRAGRVERSQYIGAGTECLVPPEVLSSTASALEIGVYGTIGGGVVRTTTFARVGGVLQGARPTDDPTQTPDLYAQLLAEMAATVKTVNGQPPDENGNVTVEGGGGGAGTPGGYYTPTVTQLDNNTMRVSYAASQDGMTDVPDVDVALPQGPTGATPNLQIGTVTTMEPGSAATASMGGTAENPVLNMGIPQGQPGAAGKTAYAYAVEGGYTGTEAEFSARLAQEIPAVDSTLTQSGQAADAAAVGDRLSALSEEIANLPSSGSGLTSAEKTAMLTLFKAAAYTADVSGTITSLETLWGGGGGSEATLSSISATYSGGDVTVGTALTDLTGIVVTATYTDGSTSTVTGYTLSGTIAEGSNTITVSYGGKDTTFTVTGVAVQTYTVTNNLTNVTNSNAATSVEAGGSYNATLTVADGCNLTSLTITMGGVDITSDVYGEGYVLITNVIGDIIITAVASVPEYVDMATGIGTNTVILYSDSGSTALDTKYYQTGAHSLNRTETEAVVKVRLTNNTESDISTSNVYIGSVEAQAIRNPNSSINVHYAISGNKGTVAAGASVEFEYTVRAGYWLYVCGYGSLDVSVVGALDVHEPTDVLATTSKAIDNFSVYSDAGTNLVEKATYRTAYATVEAFDTDTTIRLTVVSAGGNTGNILYGCVESGTLTANVLAYYGGNAAVKNFAAGTVLIIEYTVKAGYYFAVLPSSGATIYIEKT